MSFDALTLHNPLLTRLKNGDLTHFPALNDNPELTDEARAYVQESLASNTRIAYLSDLKHFKTWGGQIPASPEMVAEYIVAYADSLSVATLNRRLAALSKVHRSRGYPNPTISELVKSIVRGLRRIKGTAQRQAKPLIVEDLFLTLEATGGRLKDVRDRALLLLGFAGGFRRSELVGLTCADVETVRQGVIVTLRRSKTDQDGVGRKIGIPTARGRWCPVNALKEWMNVSGILEGALFRPVDRHNRIGTRALSGEAVCLVVRERLRAAGIDPDGFSGHSLRSGLVTSAAQAGISSWKIRQQTGHASDAMLARYIRDGELFLGNAAAALL